jgi:hypothetical protein
LRLSSAISAAFVFLGHATFAADGDSMPVHGHAVFERLVSLTWSMPYCPAGGSPWSPTGGLLAVDSAGCLGIFDATHPGVPPRILFTPTSSPANMSISWSPDGKWIACRVGYQEDSRLWAIPLSGDKPIWIGSPGADTWPFVWAGDGYIYELKGSEVVRLEKPRSSPSEAHRGTSKRIIYSPRRDRPVFLTPGESPTGSLLPDVLGRADEGDPFPDRPEFLIHRDHFGDGLPYSMVIDTAGAIRTVLDGWAREDSSNTRLGLFAACSVTSDGSWVAGFYEVDGEWDIDKAVVYLGDARGRVRIPFENAPYSVRPECSQRGRFLALDRLNGGLEVGDLKIGP